MKRVVILAVLFITLSLVVTAQQTSEDVDTVILASDENFPDAIIASSVADELGVPVMITERDELPDRIAEELAEIDPDEIILVGGMEVISERVEARLDEDYETVRLWGMTQTGTSAEVAEYVWADGSDEAIIIQYPQNGEDYWDYGHRALHAVRNAVDGQPVLLSRDGELSARVLEAVEYLDVSSVTVYTTGGEQLEDDLGEAGVESVDINEFRLQTAAQDLADRQQFDRQRMVAVASENFRDGLSVPSTPNAATMIVGSSDEFSDVVDRVNENDIEQVIVVGSSDLAAELADVLEEETDTAVRYVTGTASSVSADSVREHREEWRERHQERIAERRDRIERSDQVKEQAELFLARIDRLDVDDDRTQAWIDRAHTYYDRGEYHSALRAAQQAHSTYRQSSMRDLDRSSAAIQEQIQEEHTSLRERAQKIRELSQEMSDRMQGAETREERMELLREYRQNHQDIIAELRDEVRDQQDARDRLREQLDGRLQDRESLRDRFEELQDRERDTDTTRDSEQ